MANDKRMWWLSKTAVVIILFSSGFLYADGDRVFKNTNINEADSLSSFWPEKGKCQMSFPLGDGKEGFCFIACSNDTICGKDNKCGKPSGFAGNLCAPKCDVDNDCEYPTKCNMKEKFCFWETCKSHDDCQNSLTCSLPPYFREKFCSRRRCWEGDSQCKDYQICHPKARACQCPNGMSGKKCEVAEWCKDNGKFKDCKGVNGTCQYIKSERALNCICTNGKKLHPEENRCRETCINGADCKNGGTCEEKGGYKFCSCKLGVIGDKCETLLDCKPDGKYKNCESSGGKCLHDGNKTICECTGNKKFNDKQFICEICTCRGGECVIESGKSVCKCPPGYGNFTSNSCKVCDCGPDINCIWEARFGGSKVCLCKPGYSTKNGKCAACECGPDSNCEWLKEEWLKEDRKICHCKPGYHDENGKCVGPCTDNPCKNGGTCQDVENGYICLCPSECTEKGCTDKGLANSSPRSTTASLMTPTNVSSNVKDCHCGPFSNSCSFDLACNKLCSCFTGYYQSDGLCIECDCGDKGTCRFEKNKKICDCDPGFMENNGTCKERQSSSSRDTTESSTISTILSSTEQDIETTSSRRITESPTISTIISSTVEDIQTTSSRGKIGSSTISNILTSTQKDLETTSSMETTESPTISTIVSSTVKDCHCGTFSYSCSLDSAGTKVCNCFTGYSQLSESCAECNCGPYGTCSFEYGRKKCVCRSFAKERNGVCVDKEDLQKILKLSIYNFFL